MKAEVIEPFYDLETGLGCVPENCYEPGDVFEGTAARVNDLAERGFVKKQPARRRPAKKKG